MKFLLLLALLPALAFAGEQVLDLSDQSSSGFKAELAKHETALVEFFAPWCGHCKRLAPEYEKAAGELRTNDPAVPLAKVDCTTDLGKELCQEFGVSGYPTLKIFKQGEFAQEYNGPRESAGIVKFMRSQAGPASRAFTSFAELQTRLAAIKDVLVVGVFQSESDELAKQFHKTANQLRESAGFAHIYVDAATDSIEKLTAAAVQPNQVVLVRPPAMANKFESSSVVFDESTSLSTFVAAKQHGLVGYRTQANMADFKAPVVVAYFDVDYVKNPKGSNYWRNRVLKVAQGFEQYAFAISNSHLFAGELEEFGAQPNKDGSPVVGARDAENRKYLMSEKFSVDALQRFVEKLAAGELEPFVKSEEVPADNSGPVKVAVGKNFDELVLNSKKDVLIEFYAPWCGHCKKLAPAFEELGTALLDEPSVDIVKMDATANDVTGPFVVHGFPTIYFLPADSKTPKKYEGGREAADFISYIAKHSTEELRGYTRDGQKRKEEL